MSKLSDFYDGVTAIEDLVISYVEQAPLTIEKRDKLAEEAKKVCERIWKDATDEKWMVD